MKDMPECDCREALEEEEQKTCDFCGESCPSGALFDTDCGMICSYCLRGIESRGEKITIYQRGFE